LIKKKKRLRFAALSVLRNIAYNAIKLGTKSIKIIFFAQVLKSVKSRELSVSGLGKQRLNNVLNVEI